MNQILHLESHLVVHRDVLLVLCFEDCRGVLCVGLCNSIRVSRASGEGSVFPAGVQVQ